MEDVVVFAYNNRSDLPALAADDQAPTLPVGNLQNKQRRAVWRTTDTGGTAGHYVIVPFDADEFVEGFFMTNHNFSVNATYRIRGVTQTVTGGTITLTAAGSAVSKTGGPAWTSRMDGTDLLYGTGTGLKVVKIQTVTGADALTLAAPAPTSFTGTDYFVLDFENAYDPVNFPEGYRFDSGSVEVWKSLWGAGEERVGFHGAGGFPQADDLQFIRPIDMTLFASSQEFRFWKIHWFDQNNSDGYLEVGRLFLGPVFRPSRNFAADFRIRPFSDPSSKEDSLGQVTHSDEKQKFGQIQLKFEGVDASEAQAEFAHMQNVVGLTKDFFISLEPDQNVSNWFFSTFYGRLARQMVFSVSRINKKLRDVNLDFRESL